MILDALKVVGCLVREIEAQKSGKAGITKESQLGKRKSTPHKEASKDWKKK